MAKSVPLTRVVLVSACALLPGCKEKPAIAAPAAPPIVEVMRPIQRDEPIYAEWVGSLDGLVNADVRAQVSGNILKQDYKEGAHVKAGDLLFEIDPRPFENALAEARAAAAKAESDFKRNAELAGEQVVAKQDYDSAVAAREATRAALAQAKLNLEFTRIRSPIDGIAGLASAQIGDLVGPSTGLLTTVSTVNPIKAYFAISEQEYLEFQRHPPGGRRFPEDMDLELILSDGTVYPQHGKFFAVDRQIDANTGTIRVAGTFPNPDSLLRPGQYARIRSVITVDRGAIEVPQRAVTELQGGYQLVVVGSDHVAHLRSVEVGQRIGSRWIIAQGLKPDEQVVVEGLQKVHEGTVVHPTPFPAGNLTAGE
ncbi:MAG TPA: efflux RND transporter periplasmic adaptor subunit [Opitutaceae bacterium]|nr:efflux RND transporter periplasmic adaptor subunit [Opitutaceae bacterium]